MTAALSRGVIDTITKLESLYHNLREMYWIMKDVREYEEAELDGEEDKFRGEINNMLTLQKKFLNVIKIEFRLKDLPSIIKCN